MSKIFNHQKIETKWQKIWEKKGLYRAEDFSKKPKYYALVEFPYPSGEGLHTGHIRSYTAMDVLARKRRMQGYNVLYPIGWDAFGLPTENYAIKTGIHPKIVTKDNTDTFRRQLKSMGFSFDWAREINTTDPKYYKWTQWIFLQLYKKGLAYKKKMPINWCLSCKIGLANEEVVDGRCERCGGEIEKREKEQWMLRITKYAERLLNDLSKVDYLEKIKTQQINWIGKSEGALIKFQIPKTKFQIEVFTTRPDTLFGATYVVLSPEHELIANCKLQIANWPEVEKYIKKAQKKSDLQRVEFTKEKTGVELKGIKAINPATEKEIPIFIADYVLATYGTGAIMAVPAHDSRDFAFAKKFKLPIAKVINPVLVRVPNPAARADAAVSEIAIGGDIWEGEGELMNSGAFDGMDSEKAKWEITELVGGKKQIQYHLRDWIFSRQHYWGEPIPIIFCEKCALRDPSGQGEVPVPEKDLPVLLPDIKKYKPTNTGESPLAAITKWVNTKCPKCGGPAKRETDTMPNWAGSSWYFLRYCDPRNNKEFASMKKLKYWMGEDALRRKAPQGDAGGVDWYNGGMEHTTLHLLYSRFWNKFLYDIGIVPTSEPYQKRTSQGMVLGKGGEKMSKSKGNVVNPDTVVKSFGADTLRLYEMFMGPFDQTIPWDEKGLNGCLRFLRRVWEISQSRNISGRVKNQALERILHRTMKKVGEDIEIMAFNTAVSSLMIFANECYKLKKIPLGIWEKFLIILAPFAPFVTEELWQQLHGLKQTTHRQTQNNSPYRSVLSPHTSVFRSIHLEKWPKYDSKLIKEDNFELVVQVNGKVRDRVMATTGITQKQAEQIILRRDKINNIIKGQKIKKIIFVPNRLVNIVI